MRSWVPCLIGLAAPLAWTACGGPDGGNPPGGTGGRQPLRIAVVPKGTTHEFWRSIEAGARKAEAELNAAGTPVEVIWQGPLREDDRDQQIQVVENFTSRRVDGIVLAPLDSRALVRPAETAVEAGIPVVVIDSGLQSDKRVSYVSTDNFKGGQLAGEHLARLLDGNGKVILLRYQVGSASTEEREAGFLDALNAHPGIEVISQDQYSGPTRETGYQASQNLLNRFAGEADGVFCPCEPPTIAMAKALRDIGKAGGEIKMVGFDSGSQSVRDLENGDVQGLVVQDPVKMGFLGVMTMVQHLRGEPVEAVIDTGVQLVTPDNMGEPTIQELLHPPLEKYLKQ
jgi:ribose transport system substrate-binding protein